MILAVAATEFEMNPFVEKMGKTPCLTLISGVGGIESSLQLTRFLEKHRSDLSMVINFGVTGVFLDIEQNHMPELLDICLAQSEIVGDFGICFPMRIDDFGSEVCQRKQYILDGNLRKAAEKIMHEHDISFFSGNFVTVNGVSGTRKRGAILSRKYNGLCENMEGAALARVCEEYALPLLQLRCVSNYVEDRDQGRWKLPQACEESGRVAALVTKELEKHNEIS